MGRLWLTPYDRHGLCGAYEPLANVSYITELVIWLLTLLVWVYTPGLIGVALEAGRQANPTRGGYIISRFVSYGLFRFLVYVLGSLSDGADGPEASEPRRADTAGGLYRSPHHAGSTLCGDVPLPLYPVALLQALALYPA